MKYQLDKALTWYQAASADAFAGYAGAVNPTYITLGRRAHRDKAHHYNGNQQDKSQDHLQA